MSTSPALPRQNPVYGAYFADPFVWSANGVYYAIGTGEQEAAGKTLGKKFPVLQSVDFNQWNFASSALTPPDPQFGTHFWAPAVAAADGAFYLYYSVGFEDRNHQLRVAKSSSPQGPYEDIRRLIGPPECPFAIDPHPFQDEDGKWYLFFATDFLDTANGFRAGTGIVMARLKNMVELDGSLSLVGRAKWDWQRFQSNRGMYGATWDWHTLEGPCVTRRQGKYYCLYSGGRWETENYGVDYLEADNVNGPWKDTNSSSGPRVLKSVPEHVVGPGHNSVIAGPDGQDYIVYHAWDKTMMARRMFIDRLLWTPEGPRCDGPTWGAAAENLAAAA